MGSTGSARAFENRATSFSPRIALIDKSPPENDPTTATVSMGQSSLEIQVGEKGACN